MKTSSQRFPFQIAEYVKKHFREDFLFEVKEVQQIESQWYYTVEITKDDYIYTLKFDEKGVLLKETAEQAFPPDIHEEGSGFDNTAE